MGTLGLEGKELFDLVAVSKRVHRGEGRGHDWARLLTASPDGRMLAVVLASNSRVIQLFDGQSLAFLGKFEGHQRDISALCFSPDAKTLASSSDGHERIKLWDVSAHEELLTLGDGLSTIGLWRFAPDGRALAGITWGQDGMASVVLWHADKDHDLNSPASTNKTRSPETGKLLERSLVHAPVGGLNAIRSGR
jgi:WD40 repeat protein